jgi:CheY-like chemotaxis protein
MPGSGAIAGANLTLRERDAAATAAALSAPVLTVTAAGSKRKPREIVTIRRASEQAGGPHVPPTTSAHSGAADATQAGLHHPTLAERAADKAQLLLTQAKKDTDALSAAVAASAQLPGGIAGNATPMHMHFHRMHSNGGGAAAPFGSPSLAPAPAIALPPMPPAVAVPLLAGPSGAAASAGLVLAPAVQTGAAPRVVAAGAARAAASMAGSSSEETGGPTGARAGSAGPPVAFGPAEMLRQIRKQHSLHPHLYRTLPHPARALLAHLPGVALPPQAGLLTAEPSALPGGLSHAGSSFALSADGEGIFGGAAGSSGSQTAGRDLCLCVTDDEKTQRMMLRTFLTKWGTSVVTADEGRGCLSRVADLRVRGRMFDGICLDINMSPGMGGVETAERLRAMESLTYTCRTMLLAVTANAEPAERATYERAGFDGVVPKPVDRKLLILTVEQLSRRRRILVVEDDAVNGRLLQRLLTKAGHQAVVVTSGEAVVALATEGVAKREGLRKRYGDSLAGLTDVLSAAAARAVEEGRRSGTPDSSGGPAMGPHKRSGEQGAAIASGAGAVSSYGSPDGGTGAGAVPASLAPMHGVEVATSSTSTSHASRHTSATYTHTLTSRSDGASSSARTPHPHGELTAGLASPAAASARMIVATLSRGGLLPAAASPASPAAHLAQSVSPPFAPGPSSRAGGEVGSDASPPRAADASMHATRLSAATHSHSSLALHAGLHGSPPLSGRNRSGPTGSDGAPLPPIAELPATASLEGADGGDAVGVTRNRASSAAAQPRYRQGIHNVYRGSVAAVAADAKPGAVRRSAAASAAGAAGGVGSELEVPGVTPLRPAFEGFDLILMDLHLLPGGMDGYQCTQYLRTVLEGAYAGVPIVAMTGSVSAAEKSRCLASGMRGFLSKPIDKDELLDTIAKLTCSW